MSPRRRGFTLIELLVVIAIVVSTLTRRPPMSRCTAFAFALSAALLAPPSHADLTVEMSFDGAEVTLGSLLSQASTAGHVPLACDDALKDIALRVYGKGPAYRLLGALEWITGGQWKLEQPGWLLVGPADRPVVTELVRALPPDLADIAMSSPRRDKDWSLRTVREFVRSVTGGGDRTVAWSWKTLSEDQRNLLARLTMTSSVSRALNAVARGPITTPRGPMAEGCSIAWLPEAGNYETVEVRSPGMATLTWARNGKPVPASAAPTNVFATPVTVEIDDRPLSDVPERLCPPLDFVIMVGETPAATASLQAHGVSVYDAVEMIRTAWQVPCQGDFATKTLAVGERPLRRLLDGIPEGETPTAITLPRVFAHARGALIREGRPETQSWSTLHMDQVAMWYAQMLEGLAKHLSAPQREVLAREGCLPVEMLSTEQKEWLHAMLDLRWRQMAWLELWKMQTSVELGRLSGEVSRTRLTMKHPEESKPRAMEIPQE